DLDLYNNIWFSLDISPVILVYDQELANVIKAKLNKNSNGILHSPFIYTHLFFAEEEPEKPEETESGYSILDILSKFKTIYAYYLILEFNLDNAKKRRNYTIPPNEKAKKEKWRLEVSNLVLENINENVLIYIL